MRRLRQFVLSDTVFSCHAVSIAPSEIEVVLCRDPLLLATCDSHALGSLATRRRLYLRLYLRSNIWLLRDLHLSLPILELLAIRALQTTLIVACLQ